MPDWSKYLESISKSGIGSAWGKLYTPTDVSGKAHRGARQFTELQAKVHKHRRERPGEDRTDPSGDRAERLNALEGVRKYSAEHVVLAGLPGSGKTTTLRRLLKEEAEKALQEPTHRIPVLIELKYFEDAGSAEESGLEAIRSSLRTHGLRLDAAAIDELLGKDRFFLLFDGINELPGKKARADLAKFQRENPNTPMVFSTRDIDLLGDLDIEKRLEMEPLSEAQVREFVRLRLRDWAPRMERLLTGRVREMARRPLFLEMLCDLFKEDEHEKLPTTLGAAFRKFTGGVFLKKKGELRLKRRHSRSMLRELLGPLAFTMMEGKTPTAPDLHISRREAREVFIRVLRHMHFDDAGRTADDCLNDLLAYHLIELQEGERVVFPHQLIQEYYAAEHMVDILGRVRDGKGVRDGQRFTDRDFDVRYLNCVKWTETIAMCLELLDDKEQALNMVRRAIAIDPALGARLAGSVKQEWQRESVRLIESFSFTDQTKVGPQIKPHLLGLTRSLEAVGALIALMGDEDWSVRSRAAVALGKIGSDAAVEHRIKALGDKDRGVRSRAAEALGKIGSDAAVEHLIKALGDKDASVRFHAAEALGEIGSDAAVEHLIKALGDEHWRVCSHAAEALEKTGRPVDIRRLLVIALRQDYVELFGSVATIQFRVGFYSYELWVKLEEQAAPERNSPVPITITERKGVAVKGTFHLLHLSDLHFGGAGGNEEQWQTDARTWARQLLKDLATMGCRGVDAVVISGDITHECREGQFKAAEVFLEALSEKLGLVNESFVIVPGNHDVDFEASENGFEFRKGKPADSTDKRVIVYTEHGGAYVTPTAEAYGRRFVPYAAFYERVTGREFPSDDYGAQWALHEFREKGLLILALNSAWDVNHLKKDWVSINQEALNRALTGLPDDHDHFLKICVWHHPYGNPPDECRIKDDQVMKDLANNGFRVVLHGHAHREMSLIIPYDREAFGCKMEVIAAGTFGARANPKEGRYPYVYHLIEIRGAKAKVNSRTRNMPLGVWDPCGKYKAKGLDSNVLLQPFYEFDL